MDIWLCLPTADADKCGACFMHWRAAGYRCAALCNGPAFSHVPDNADFVIQREAYPGWGNSINLLGRAILETSDAIIVGAGDDMLPDPNFTAGDIAAQFMQRFPDGMGVMQPCGDPWPGNAHDICGSPWLGAAFMRRWNGGRGAFWPDYVHHYADEELCCVTMRHGLLWQRDDLIQRHEHWSRHGTVPPEYMADAYAANRSDMNIFRARKRDGFPGHQPIDG